MELAANGDLLDYINSRQFLSEAESRHVFRQVCDAVFYCHEIEIAHRDLKCENIMLDRNMDVKLGGESTRGREWGGVGEIFLSTTMSQLRPGY